MVLMTLSAAMALLAGAPPSAVPVPAMSAPTPWGSPRKTWAVPAVAQYGERLMRGAAEAGPAAPLRGRLTLTDIADPAFACHGWYENRRRDPRLDLKCSDGSRIAITFHQPRQGRAFGEGQAGDARFRFRFRTDLAAR